ncbi:hypothetical protein [Nocardia jinanensis]|nr:hypothetical protein [Nocardia jinanensis]
MYLESTGEVLAVAEATMVVGSGSGGARRAVDPRPDFLDRHIALRRTARDGDCKMAAANPTHDRTTGGQR